MWISVSVFIFLLVNSALALSALRISQYMTVNVFPMSIQEANAIKKNTSNQAKTLANNGSSDHAASSSTTSLSSSPATTSSSSCISYTPSTRTITVSCTSVRLSDIYNELHDNSILAKQSPAGTWFLDANIVIAKGATLHIDSTDTKWLKISSKVTPGETSKFGQAYWIDVHGGLKIDSVKITSWDPTTN